MRISTPGSSEPGVKPPSNAESTLEFKPHSFSRVCITAGVFFDISEDDLEFVVIDLMIPGIRGQPGILGYLVLYYPHIRGYALFGRPPDRVDYIVAFDFPPPRGGCLQW